MKRAIFAAILVVPMLAFAQAKKGAPAAAPKPVAVTEEECDMHKSLKAIVEAAMTGKGKAEMVDMNDGQAVLVWSGETKGVAGLDAAAAGLSATMQAAQEGKAKMCEFHLAVGAGMKDGKALAGSAKLPMGYMFAMQSSDPALVKAAQEQTAKFKAMMAAPKAAAPAAPAPAAGN